MPADADSDEAGPGWMIAIDPILVARDRLSEELARLDTLVRDQARRLTTRLWRSATG